MQQRNRKMRVAIVGVGNCASSLVQGVEYCKSAGPDDVVPGLMHVNLGGCHIRDIEFSAAFDVDIEKIGEDLSESIWAGQNNTIEFDEAPHLGVTLERGMTDDGLGTYLSQVITKAPGPTADTVRNLKETETDILINSLPVGSEMATKWNVEQTLDAGSAFVNGIPAFIAHEEDWQKRFRERNLPTIGDDITSHVGATITHRELTRLIADRGVPIDRTHQLNVGGNTDFMNVLEREPLESKKNSKTNAVTSQLAYAIEPKDVHVGPSDDVPWHEGRTWGHIRMDGTTFRDAPLNMELALEDWDSLNSAGVVIDAVRRAKLALDNNISDALPAPSAYVMQSPPAQYHDDQAREMVEEYVRETAADAAIKLAAAETPAD